MESLSFSADWKSLNSFNRKDKDFLVQPKPGYHDGSGILVEGVSLHVSNNNMRKEGISGTGRRKGEHSTLYSD